MELEKLVLDELKPFFAHSKSWHIAEVRDIPKTRDWLLEGQSPPELSGALREVKISEREIPNVMENGMCSVRIYTPNDDRTDRSLIVFFRGSGFIIGRVWQHDAFAAQLCAETGSVVVSADYRLAPENPYPAAIHDCWSALVWADKNREALGTVGGKLILLGCSAGGGLAVTAALMARDAGKPRIDMLCPLYPMLDAGNDGRSNREIINGHVWDGAKNGTGWQAYLGRLISTQEPDYTMYASAAETYRGLPPVYTYIAQYDALRDELLEFQRRLTEDEVPVELHIFPGCFHSFEISYPHTELGRMARSMLTNAIIRALNK